MKGFVLPPLHSSTKGPLWCSQVQLPTPAAQLITTQPKIVLPAVDRGHRREEIKRLQAKTVELEAAAQQEQLRDLERSLRNVLCGREHEKRYKLLWQYQEEKTKVERETAVAEAKALQLQRMQYLQGVQNYKARGEILHFETITRNQLILAEVDARNYLVSLFDIKILEEQCRKAEREANRAESFFRDMKNIRDWEIRIAKTSFHSTETFTPSEPLLFSQCSNNKCKGKGYQGRTDLLMDYTICEEEWQARIVISYEERLAQLTLEWQHSTMRLALVEEPKMRKILEDLCSYGSCQARLSAILCIQRWWRMLYSNKWSIRKRQELRRCVTKRRLEMTTSDFNIILERIKRYSVTVNKVPSLTEIKKSMSALEKAVELSYQNVFDYFVYTLMNRAANLQATEQHRLSWLSFEKDDGIKANPPVSSLLSVPNRVYVRQQTLQPYPIWRALRWVEGSTHFKLLVQQNEEAETKSREILLQREAKEVETLWLYHAALKNGSWAWRSLYTTILLHNQEEEMCRSLIQQSEEDSRALITVDAAASLLNCLASSDARWQLINEESIQREIITENENNDFLQLTCNEWQWKNLLRVRTKIRLSCSSKLRWKIARDHGLGRQFVSLDSAARVIVRFFRIALGRIRRAGLRRPTPAVILTKVAQDMTRLLEEEFDEEIKNVRYIKLYCSSAEVHTNTAIELFTKWFDAKAQEPMERKYKEIVARFLQTHQDLYQQMHLLFAVVQRGRERIELQESKERDILLQGNTFLNISLYELQIQEINQRKKIEEEFRLNRLKWDEQAEILIALAKSTRISTNSNITTTKYNNYQKSNIKTILNTTREKPIIIKKSIIISKKKNLNLNILEKIISREDILRVRLIMEERKFRSEFLFSLHNIFRESMIEEENKLRKKICEYVDLSWPINPPIAQISLLTSIEMKSRNKLEETVCKSYASPLERGCFMYAQKTLFPRFLRGHLSFESEARYFDRRLTELLLQRLTFLNEKREEFIAMETCARARVEYLEETHRNVYLNTWKFLE